MDETMNVAPGSQGSLEQGLSGNYELSFGGLISEAWHKTAGHKGAVWIAMALYLGVALAISLLFGGFNPGPIDPNVPEPPSTLELVGNLVSAIVLMPMAAGLSFYAVALARGDRPRAMSLFSWYDKTVKLVLTSLLMNILIGIGLLLLVLPGIYLAVSYQIALPLMVDKKLGIWEALESSRKIIGHNWFLIFGLDIVIALVLAASFILFGIPLIWTVPACLIGYGILYHTLVGIEADTLQRTLASGA